MKSLTDDRGTFVVNALIRLENNEDFKMVKSWVDASFEDIKRQLIDTRGENTFLAQGYADALRDVTESFNNPRHQLEIARIQSNNNQVIKDTAEAVKW